MIESIFIVYCLFFIIYLVFFDNKTLNKGPCVDTVRSLRSLEAILSSIFIGGGACVVQLGAEVHDSGTSSKYRTN